MRVTTLLQPITFMHIANLLEFLYTQTFMASFVHVPKQMHIAVSLLLIAHNNIMLIEFTLLPEIGSRIQK